jgi:hypothetical protein
MNASVMATTTPLGEITWPPVAIEITFPAPLSMQPWLKMKKASAKIV